MNYEITLCASLDGTRGERRLCRTQFLAVSSYWKGAQEQEDVVETIRYHKKKMVLNCKLFYTLFKDHVGNQWYIRKGKPILYKNDRDFQLLLKKVQIGI